MKKLSNFYAKNAKYKVNSFSNVQNFLKFFLNISLYNKDFRLIRISNSIHFRQKKNSNSNIFIEIIQNFCSNKNELILKIL